MKAAGFRSVKIGGHGVIPVDSGVPKQLDKASHGRRVKFGKACFRRQVGADKRRVYETCAACERCCEHEKWLKGVVEEGSRQAAAIRRKRGSQFDPSNALLWIETGAHAPKKLKEISAEQAFALLAPPISFKTEVRDIVTSSAAKLYFALVGCRRHLDARVSAKEKADEHIWYLTQKETERMLVCCGVDWMSREQAAFTHHKLDLNNSGSVHISEASNLFESAIGVCREILNGEIDWESIMGFLEACVVGDEESSLAAQLQRSKKNRTGF